MKDANLILILGLTAIVFSLIAAYFHTAITHFARRSRLRPPHPALLAVTRIWFALLALGCVTLLILPLFHHK